MLKVQGHTIFGLALDPQLLQQILHWYLEISFKLKKVLGMWV